MPFQEVSKMHLRKQMVQRIMGGELTIAAASREYGIARNTVKLWITRFEEGSLSELKELSRRPAKSPMKTADELEEKLLELKARWPTWGAKKLMAKLWPEEEPFSLRTANRILKRHNWVQARGETPPVQRFQKEAPNEMWQMDFKGLGHFSLYSPLTILDDASRFCLAFEPLESHRASGILDALWIAFGEYGLPDSILMDNEPCFAEIRRCGPSWLESRLWLLGIRTLHGKPYHPQTQGKVERFHQTIQKELGKRLHQKSIPLARAVYGQVVHDYNYERPHESLDMKVPAQLYRPSAKKRPAVMPIHEIPAGSLSRRVEERGLISYKAQEYRVGRGLAGQTVELREDDDGMAAFFAGKRLGLLREKLA